MLAAHQSSELQVSCESRTTPACKACFLAATWIAPAAPKPRQVRLFCTSTLSDEPQQSTGRGNKLGQYYCWNRTYDVNTGRWTTPDPVATPWWNLCTHTPRRILQSVDASGLDPYDMNDLYYKHWVQQVKLCAEKFPLGRDADTNKKYAECYKQATDAYIDNINRVKKAYEEHEEACRKREQQDAKKGDGKDSGPSEEWKKWGKDSLEDLKDSLGEAKDASDLKDWGKGRVKGKITDFIKDKYKDKAGIDAEDLGSCALLAMIYLANILSEGKMPSLNSCNEASNKFKRDNPILAGALNGECNRRGDSSLDEKICSDWANWAGEGPSK